MGFDANRNKCYRALKKYGFVKWDCCTDLLSSMVFNVVLLFKDVCRIKAEYMVIFSSTYKIVTGLLVV